MELRYERVSMDEGSSFSCFKRTSKAFRVPLHIHEEIELVHIIRSHGIYFVGNQPQNFKPGDLMLFGANVPHAFHSDLKDSFSATWAKAIVLQFKINCFGGGLFQSRELKPIGDLFEKAQRGIRFGRRIPGQTATILDSLATEKKQLDRFLLFIECFKALVESDDYELITSQAHKYPDEVADRNRLQRVLDYISKNYREPISLEKVARLASMTPQGFSRYFHQRTRKTMSAYIMEIRIEHACRLLLETDEKITEVAYQSGYNNLSNFNRQFMKVKGVSPKDYRKQFSEFYRGC